jgi:hypothetical protein
VDRKGDGAGQFIWPRELQLQATASGVAIAIKKSARGKRSLFGWLVADDWCWFVLREEYCWLVAAGCWWLVRSERKVLLAGG